MEQYSEEKRGKVSGWLYRFMENHAPWFWVIFSVVTVLGLYKAFSLTFLEKTPYTWDYTFHHITLSLLCILMMREAYQGKIHMGFRTQRFGVGILMCWPAVVFILINLGSYLCIGRIYPESLIMELMRNVSIGLFEEVVVRAVLVGHMMYHWRNSRRRVFLTVLWSSVLFGVLHIGNALENPVGTFIQIFYAMGFGVMFAAVYIRTRNLWSCILVHALVDFSANITNIFVPVQLDAEAYAGSMSGLTYFMPAFAPESILSVWSGLSFLGILVGTALAIVVGVFMLRRSKAAEIADLWADM